MTPDESMPLLDVEIRQIESTTVIVARGEIDLTTSSMVDNAVATALSTIEMRALVVDLTEVTFLASTGMTTIVDAAHKLGELDAHFAVVADGPRTRRPLELVGLDEVVMLHADLDTALKAIPPAR